MSVEKIKEYCRRLGKHSDNNNVLKETLYKLNKMEVTVDILQETGIGKVVNSLKHRGGKTGDMAADLIKKWRNVVDREAEQEQVEENNNNKSHHSSHHRTEVKRESHHHDSKSSRPKESSSSHRKSDKGSKDRSNAKMEEPALFSDVSVVSTKPSAKSSKHDDSKHSSHKKSSDHHHRIRHSSHKKAEKKETAVPSPGSSSSSSSASEKQIEQPIAPLETHTSRASSDAHRSSAGKKRKAPEEDAVDEGMSANFGSFEECLGTNDPKNLKKKKKLKSSSSPKMTVTSSTLNGSSSQPKGPRLPDLIDKKLLESRPVIDYKPLPRIEPKVQVPQKRAPTIDEAAQFTSSRKDRTAIYSGRRNATLTSVPTLFDACIRILIDNIDYIEETGGVPYDILKPVLERCTWQQLYNLEYHNPYLTEDSDPLWEIHCRKDFRNKAPMRGEESWKELYLRCHDEREQKLRSLTASISQSMRDRQAPVRTTKLAYVDSIAKAPLNVQRAQLKNGTFVGNKAQPSQARKIASQAAAAAASEPVRAPSSAAPRKPKLAPLMAKTLSFLKMRKSTGYGFASR